MTTDAAEPSSARLVLTLTLAGFLSGFAIVGIYELTRPRIAAYQAAALEAAVLKVLPGAMRMQALMLAEGRLREASAAQQASLYAAYDREGGFAGYAIPAEGPGFQDTIRLLYGYLPKRRMVTGMEVLDSRETPGLGDKIYKDQGFVDSFHGLSIEPEVRAVKKGAKSASNELDAITGATISSKAVVAILNQSHARWRERLAGPPEVQPPRGE